MLKKSREILRAMKGALGVKDRVSTKYTVEDYDKGLYGILSEEITSVKEYRRKAQMLYELMEEVIDEVLPKKVYTQIGMFAEIKSVGWGVKATFTAATGKARGKQFITRVALNGVYETFKLDVHNYTVDTHAYGGAAYVDMFDIIMNRMTMADLLDIILEGIEERVYSDIWAAIKSIKDTLPSNNIHSGAGFSAQGSSKVINTVSAYGIPYVLCFPTFAQTIREDATFIGNQDKSDMREKGYIGKWRGANVVVMPNSFTDIDNATRVFDESFAFVLGSGRNDKIVKVVMEGETRIEEYKNRDHSTEISAMKMIGTAVSNAHQIGLIENTDLTDTKAFFH